MEFMGTALAYLPDYSQMIQPRRMQPDTPALWAVDFVEWIRMMVRKHRYICVGYEKLWRIMGVELRDPLVSRTLEAMGIAPPNLEALLQAARISCQGWDQRGVYFVNGTQCGDCSILDDIAAGRAWIAPDYAKDTSGTDIKFIGVTRSRACGTDADAGGDDGDGVRIRHDAESLWA